MTEPLVEAAAVTRAPAVAAVTRAPAPADLAPHALARRVVDGARQGVPDEAAIAALAALDPAGLAESFTDNDARMAFWLNVYNATVRIRLLADPTRYRRRWRFFAAAAVTVAGRRLSLNAIEHGLLRRSAFLAGLGYIRNPVPSRFERALRVDRVGPRIHFALNCGARSCPPVAAWDPATLDDDLERATAAYLRAESGRHPDGTLRIPRLLRWYRGDFGGGSGILALLRRHGIIERGERPRLRYGPYDWTLDLGETPDRP